MDVGVTQLAETIAEQLRTWDTPPHVELAVYGTGDARAIAGEVAAFCRRELGGAVARGLFHLSSIGSVTAVELADGRRVVVKAHHSTSRGPTRRSMPWRARRGGACSRRATS